MTDHKYILQHFNTDRKFRTNEHKKSQPEVNILHIHLITQPLKEKDLYDLV